MKQIFIKINFVTHHELYRIRKTLVSVKVSSTAKHDSHRLCYLSYIRKRHQLRNCLQEETLMHTLSEASPVSRRFMITDLTRTLRQKGMVMVIKAYVVTKITNF